MGTTRCGSLLRCADVWTRLRNRGLRCTFVATIRSYAIRATRRRSFDSLPLPPLVLLRLDRAHRGGVGVLSEIAMRFSLRTLIIVMLLGGPLCAWGWREWVAYRLRRLDEGYDLPSFTKRVLPMFPAETNED